MLNEFYVGQTVFKYTFKNLYSAELTKIVRETKTLWITECNSRWKKERGSSCRNKDENGLYITSIASHKRSIEHKSYNDFRNYNLNHQTGQKLLDEIDVSIKKLENLKKTYQNVLKLEETLNVS